MGYCGRVTAPRGKGIYGRGMGLYPDRDPAGYAASLGCQWVAFLDFPSHNPSLKVTSDDQIKRAKYLGLTVLLWSGPDSWLPDNWPIALDTMAERVDRLGIDQYRDLDQIVLGIVRHFIIE